ncbi:hypothetical protein JCM8097_009256 [Rhodosporidiobolus ruineniae]
MATVDLKLTLASGETRVLSLPASPAPSWSALSSSIQQRFALDAPPTAVTYLDDDGDEITLSSDAELAELFAAQAGETTFSLLVVLPSLDKPAGPPPRSPETVALLDAVRTALEADFTLAHDLRSVVHDVLREKGRFRHFHHSKNGFAGGRGGRHPHAHHHGQRFHHHRRDFEETSSSSEEEEDDDESVTEKQASPEQENDKGESRHKHKHGRRGHKDHARFPPHPDFFGPPPPHFARGFEGAFPPPPPPHHAFVDMDFFPPGPPGGRRHHHGKKGGKHAQAFHHHPPPPPPPHFAFFDAEEADFRHAFVHHPFFAGGQERGHGLGGRGGAGGRGGRGGRGGHHHRF